MNSIGQNPLQNNKKPLEFTVETIGEDAKRFALNVILSNDTIIYIHRVTFALIVLVLVSMGVTGTPNLLEIIFAIFAAKP